MTHHDRPNKETCGAVLAGIGIGALLAGVLALLLAPKAGEKTRSELKHSVNDAKARVGSLIEAVKDKARTAVEGKTSALSHAIEAGKRAYAEKRDELESRVKTGD